jgi:hypothetical protein
MYTKSFYLYNSIQKGNCKYFKSERQEFLKYIHIGMSLIRGMRLRRFEQIFRIPSKRDLEYFMYTKALYVYNAIHLAARKAAKGGRAEKQGVLHFSNFKGIFEIYPGHQPKKVAWFSAFVLIHIGRLVTQCLATIVIFVLNRPIAKMFFCSTSQRLAEDETHFLKS